MTKATNKWAIAMWVAAGLYAVGLLVQLLGANSALVAGPGYLFTFLWDVFQRGALYCGMLAGLGALIELVDRARWEAANRRNPNSGTFTP
jgi:hypothetical protein